MKSKSLGLDWKSYENLISGLFVGADLVKVEKDITLTDKDGSERQIDCLVTVTFGPHTFRVLVECKSGKNPIKREAVDKLMMTKEKVNASQAILFANSTFQKGTVNTAKVNGIRLLNAKEPLPNDWVPSQTIKVICHVFCVVLQNKIHVSSDKLEIGSSDPLSIPKGVRVPQISFYPTRTNTPVLGRSNTLEDMIEDALFDQIGDPLSQEAGVIGDGRDCIGQITKKCFVAFENPIHIVERKEPLVILRISELSINAAIRLEQRSFVCKSPNELHNALIIHDVCSDKKYQVGQESLDSIWSWTEVSKQPLGSGLENKQKISVVSRESFNPNIFDNPWASFDKTNIFDEKFMPTSKTMQDVFGVLANPDKDSEKKLENRRHYSE